MARSLKLTVVSPERALVDVETEEVQLPGLGGYMGILPGHAPLFSELSIGRLSYSRAGATHTLVLAGGFVEVRDDHVHVLATVAEAGEDIDVERARKALGRARERLAGSDHETDYERARRAERRATARLEVAEGSDQDR